MVEVRKLLEQKGSKTAYEYLTFHCDWAVHFSLQGTTAQKILRCFDSANLQLKDGLKLHELPGPLKTEIQRISKMSYFERQLEYFLKDNGLPSVEGTRPDGWSHFLHLYVKIVEDSPLVMATNNTSASVASVTLKTEMAKKRVHGDRLYKVTWLIQDKNGKSGEINVFNSFSAESN